MEYRNAQKARTLTRNLERSLKLKLRHDLPDVTI